MGAGSIQARVRSGARGLAGFAIAAMLLAGCGIGPGASTAAPASGEWTPESGSAAIAGLNIHTTSLGYAGSATAPDGSVHPVRNIRASETSLSFIVPTLDGAFSGTWDAKEKRWSGVASIAGAAAPVTLAHGKAKAPAIGGPYSRPQQLVRLADGREMNLYCLGQGAPTVILEYGAGGTSADWSDVHAKLAETTHVCAYDRAGHGFSDPGPMPRDASAVVSDLEAMLKAAKIAPPYVLAGHSLGSLHVRLFANRHFTDVAGMVLVDPSGDFQTARIDAAVPKMAATRGNNDGLRKCIGLARDGLVRRDTDAFRQCRQNDPDLMESRMSEGESMQTTSSEQTSASRRAYGDMPLMVLTRGDNAGAPPQLTQADIDAYYGVWMEMHREFAALSTSGRHRVVEGAKHYIQRDKPETVIAAINEVVAEARRRGR
jgi:pimeloyl-ACP methyl ester carboxylesterase